ncbi:hypothetical protein NE237_017303 [Protea cynaroides]|uniref:Uncharacterized protein n=1 Tax=Protea cynaroides TaxID=273540 RepID=A0A9Q0K7S0_9MAGN|nr:hypothetical protein NE237_017303 [Protea cynaroides]
MVDRHNLYLHSALVLTRRYHHLLAASMYFLIESGFAFFIAFLINVAVVSVTGTNVLGKSSSIIYAIALLACGQSSTVTGTYAGQFIMQMILSFELPFLSFPLLKFSSNNLLGSGVMHHWNQRLLLDYRVCRLANPQHLPKVSNVFIGIFVFPIMALYISLVNYLTFRKDTAVTFIDAPKLDHNIQTQMEKGFDVALRCLCIQ